MIRLLWIPVAGTIAALVAILVLHEPRDAPGARRGDPPLPPIRRDAPPPPPGDDGEDEIDVEREVPDVPEIPDEPGDDRPPAPPPAVRTLQLRLESDGALVDLDAQMRYAGIDEARDALGDVRHKVLLTNGEDVTEEALDEALDQLARHYDVRKLYKGP